MRSFLPSACLLSFGLLTGCSGAEPSSADMQAAIQQYMLGPDSKVIDKDNIWLDEHETYKQYTTAEKVACKVGNETPGAVCDFNFTMCYAKADAPCEQQSRVFSGRFTKGDKGWAYVPTDPSSALPKPADIIDEIMMQDIMRNGGMAGS